VGSFQHSNEHSTSTIGEKYFYLLTSLTIFNFSRNILRFVVLVVIIIIVMISMYVILIASALSSFCDWFIAIDSTRR
jgi:hypothetical protein